MDELDFLLLLLLTQRGALEESGLKVALHAAAHPENVPLGTQLVQEGLLTPDQLERAMAEAEQLLAEQGWDIKHALITKTQQLRPAQREELWKAFPELAWRSALLQDGKRFTDGVLFAQGGLGTIWKVREVDTGRSVLLKQLRPELSHRQELVQRFLAEGKITAQLEHRSIVTVYYVSQGDLSYPPFYVMRIAEGRTLSEAIREVHAPQTDLKTDRLVPRDLIRCLINVCEAVAYAHSRGVIHRDLKPENVIVSDLGGATVLDWGLGKILSQGELPGANLGIDADDLGLTQCGDRVGTPLWMAPEQAAGALEHIDERTDIYGLGATLFTILTGKPPHGMLAAATAKELFQKIESSRSPHARDLDPSVSPTLDAICAKAMAPEPAERYSSARAMIRDLQNWLDGASVSVYRSPWSRRLARQFLRHPVAAVYGVGITAFVSICAVLLIAAMMLNRRQFVEVEMNGLAGLGRFAQIAIDAEMKNVEHDVIFLRYLPGLASLPLNREMTTENAPMMQVLTLFLGRSVNAREILLVTEENLAVSMLRFRKTSAGEVVVDGDRSFEKNPQWQSFSTTQTKDLSDGMALWDVVDAEKEQRATYVVTALSAPSESKSYLWLRLDIRAIFDEALRITEYQAAIVERSGTPVFQRVGSAAKLLGRDDLKQLYEADIQRLQKSAESEQVIRHPAGRILLLTRPLVLTVDRSRREWAVVLLASLDQIGMEIEHMRWVLTGIIAAVFVVFLAVGIAAQRILTALGQPE